MVWSSQTIVALIALLSTFVLIGCVDGRLFVRPANSSAAPLSYYAPLMQLPKSSKFSTENTTREILVDEDIFSPQNYEARLPLYRDRIVVSRNIFDGFNDSLFTWMERACQHAYALVLPYGEWDYGLGYPEYSLPHRFRGVSCRTYTISLQSLRGIKALVPPNGTIATAEISGDDGITPVKQWFTSGWFFFLNILLAVTSCGISVVGATRLWDYYLATKSCMPQIATICLWLEVLSGLVRFFYWAIDPYGSRGIIPTFTAQSAFRTASLPLTISSTVLISFYWHESLSSTSLKVSLNVSRLRIPAYIVCALCFIFEIVSWIFYLSDLTSGATGVFRILNQIWYIIVIAAMAIFYAITSIRVFWALRRSQNKSSSSAKPARSTGSESSVSSSSSRNRHMRTITIKLTLSSVAMIFFVCIAVLVPAPFYSVAPNVHPGYMVFWWVAHTIVNMKAFAAILAFTPRTR